MLAFIRHHLRCALLRRFSRAALIEELADRRAITPAIARAIRTGDKAALLHAVSGPALITALEERGVLSEDEAETLSHGRSLDSLYGSKRTARHHFDADAAEAAQDAIRRGDLDEALIQAGRALTHLRDLPHLAAKTRA